MAAYVTRWPTKSVWVARSPPGFAFIEFETEQDAQACIDVVHDARLGHQNVTAQFAKTNGPKEPPPAKPAPSCRHRAVLKNLPASFSWRELQDEMRQLAEMQQLGSVIYADMDAQGDGHVEFASAEDLDRAVQRLHGSRLDGNYIVVYKEAEGPPPASSYDPPPASSYDDRGGGYDARAPAGSGAYGSGTYDRGYDRSYNRGYSRYDDVRQDSRYEGAYGDRRSGTHGSYRERERDGLYARGGGGSGGYDGARSNGYGYQNYEQGGQR